jgi:hypothetical protein
MDESTRKKFKAADNWMATKNSDTESWTTYQRLVLHELERLNDRVEMLITKQTTTEIDIARIKTQATIFGTIGGVIISLIGWAIELVTRNNGGH